MKKIGEYTARGIVTETETEAAGMQRISLFDGRFDTGYRVTSFKIWSSSYSDSTTPDCMGKLSKNDDGVTSATNFMRADDNNQIAWAGAIGNADAFQAYAEIIDRDNMIIEDLYVYARTTTGAQGTKINYLVELDKYDITDWQGALAMARDRAQGDI